MWGEKMKKIIGLLSLVISGLIITGCTVGEKDIVKEFKKKVNNINGYYITGTLSIVNNEEQHKYNIEVSYQKSDQFRVNMKNKINNHEQIILKNDEGVYLLTPSLNKSFKFQSEWPYNNSQSYLLQTLITDIENDKNLKIKKNKKQYIITTKAHYPNNSSLKEQKIYLDKKANVKKVEVLNSEGIVKIKMDYNKIDMKANFDKKYFDLNENMKASIKTKETSKEINDIIYPMYMPDNTYLESQNTVKTDNGERVILTFAGDSPFMIIEETVASSAENEIIPVSGDPIMVLDTIGSVTGNSANWISNGIEYYAVSEVLDSEQLLEVVNSISSVPISK